MKKRLSGYVLWIMLCFFPLILTNCIYTSNIVFPNKNEALYCFLDPENAESYLYKIDINTRVPELESKFPHPISAISLSQDRKSLFYFEIVKNEGEKDSLKDKLNLKMISLNEIKNTDTAKTICTFLINSQAGAKFGTSWGITNILPIDEKDIAYVLYIEQENKVILAKVDLKNGNVKTIDEGIITYVKISPNLKFIAYTKSQKIRVEKDDEGKDMVESSIVILDADSLKEVGKKDVGIWQIPPQFSFLTAGKEDYKIIFPSPESETNQSGPKGAKIQMHYISSLQYISGTKRLFIYGPGEKDEKAIGEICDLNSNIIETINCGEFLPISWSPDESFFFLGSNNYLAQYIVGRKIFAVYKFIPPKKKDEEPKIHSMMLRELPENTGKDFWTSKGD